MLRFILLCALGPLVAFPREDRTQEESRLSPYLQLGGSRFETLAGNYEAFTYALGAEYSISSWFSVDLGFADFGTAHTESVPQLSVLDIVGNSGQEIRRRAGYILPTLRWTPAQWLSLALGAGPAQVQTRVRRYGYLFINPKVSSAAQDESHLEVLLKFTADFKFTDSWALSLQGFGVRSAGFSSDYERLPFRYSSRMRSIAATIGLRYEPRKFGARASESLWSARIGPAISRLSFHANYRTTPIGYDLAIKRNVLGWMFLELGYTEYGTSRKRPRYPNGAPLNTPPFSPEYPDGDLQVNVGSTYFTVGAEGDVGRGWTAGAAVGAARTVATFQGMSPVFLAGRYVDITDTVHMLGQVSARRELGKGWSAGIGVRYTEVQGPQIIFRAFDPDFGNTDVRILTVIPQVSLGF